MGLPLRRISTSSRLRVSAKYRRDEAKGGVNLLDAVFRGAAPHHQRRGNVILFDSDLAAKVGTVYARIDETIGFSKTNNLRRIDTTDSSGMFPQKNLATYMKRDATSGEIVLQTNLASSVRSV